MFPGGSPHLVEPIYKNPKLSAPFNEQLAEAVVLRVRHLLPSLGPGQKVSFVGVWMMYGYHTSSCTPSIAHPYGRQDRFRQSITKDATLQNIHN